MAPSRFHFPQCSSPFHTKETLRPKFPTTRFAGTMMNVIADALLK